jgi:AcrR family transcriptional regulator
MSTDVPPPAGEPDRSLALLWRAPADPADTAERPGPRSPLGVDRVVGAAVRLADAEGLAAVSMRRLATELGVATMTIYGHVPGRAELVDLMHDTVLAELYPDEGVVTSGAWRTRLKVVARANRELFHRHPWARAVAGTRRPPGPGAMRKYELELRAVTGLGPPELEMHLLVTSVDGFVRGAVGGAEGETVAPGVDLPWQAAAGSYADRALDPGRFPTAARVAPAAGRALRAGDPATPFEFGLERLLDGIGVLILEASR